MSNVSTGNAASTNAGQPISPQALRSSKISIPTSSVPLATLTSRETRRSCRGFFGFAPTTIALEPTVVEEQKARYLNALHELRRINEGDDTADSPGYSLNLVRLPVSILPGNRTDVGYGTS